MVSLKKLVPVALSIPKGYLTVLGILIPNLWVFCQYLILTLDMIWYFQRSTSLTHHLNAGCYWKILATAYSANSIRLECFKSTKGPH